MRCSSLVRRAGAAVAGVLLAFSGHAAQAEDVCFCMADYNGSSVVDGADLGLLLGAWGTINPAFDLTGNGFIDGADLGMLLGAWGPCPGPANDNCANASPVVADGVYHFCNLYAATDGPALPQGSCEAATQIHKDVWYRFDATSDGILIVDTCLGNANWNEVLAVYGATLPGISPCPTGGASLAPLVSCSDNTPNTFGCTFTEAYARVPVSGGHSYKIRVGGRSVNDYGNGVLHVQFQQYGSSCGYPIDASNSQAIVEILGTTVDNEVDNLPSNCFGPLQQGPAEWIRYTAACTGTLVIATCHPNTNFDTVLNVMLESPSTSGCWETLLACNDDSPAPGCLLNGLNRKSRVEVHVNSGDVLKIAVSGYSGASGDYGLVITRVCD